MKADILVSVVVPVYNGEKTIAKCLQSILSQPYSNLEVLVVDNGSADLTAKIIKDLANSDSRVRYLFEPFRSRGAARNTGQRAALGEIIGMTDADCVAPHFWVNKMIEPILAGQCQAVQGGEKNIDWRSKYITPKFKKSSSVVGRINTNNFFITKDALAKIGFFDQRFFRNEDTELSIRLEKDKVMVKFLDIIVNHFRNYSVINNIVKFYEGGYWCAKATKKHADFLKGHQFLKDTNQTVWTFFKFFPGLLKTMVVAGPMKAWHDLVSGLMWRLGLIHGWLTKL